MENYLKPSHAIKLQKKMNNSSERFATKKLWELLKTHEVEPQPNYDNIFEKELTFLNEPFEEDELEENYDIVKDTLREWEPSTRISKYTETMYSYFFRSLTNMKGGKIHYSKLYDLIIVYLNNNNNRSHFHLQLPNFIHTLLLINELPLPQIALKIIETEFIWDWRMKVKMDFNAYLYNTKEELDRRLLTSNYVKDLNNYETETMNDILNVETDIYNEIKEEYDVDTFMDATQLEIEDWDDLDYYRGADLLNVMEDLGLDDSENYELLRTKTIQNSDADSLGRLCGRFFDRIFNYRTYIKNYNLEEIET